MRGTPEERFWAKVDTSGECWEWTGYKIQHGYGIFNVNGKITRGHRFSYELLVGPIPEGLVIDHQCHNPGCVNPEHLRAVTVKQNAENKVTSHRGNISGVRGVSWRKDTGKWEASCMHFGKKYSVGCFTDLEEAAAAVSAKRRELFTHSEMDKAA